MNLIIDDSNAHIYAQGTSTCGGRGLIPRDLDANPHGSMGFAAAFDLPIIPRTEWSDRIKEMKATESRLSDVWRLRKLEPLNQGQTNYCWAHGPVTAMMIIRAVNNLPSVRLAATAVGAQVKNFKNVGGWGGEALAFIVEHGVPSTEFWTPNDINRKYVTQAMKDNAALHKVVEWYDLKPRSFDQLMTCLLLRIPVAVGYNWWSHEVCAIDPVEISPNNYGADIMNSWGLWSDDGIATLTESKAIPDDAVAPRVVSFSDN